MHDVEVLIVGLLVAVAGLGALARWVRVPYPIVLVIGGALVGFVPGIPRVELQPEVVLVVFLPPLLYKAAIYANFGDFRAGLRSLVLSTVGLVLATMAVVAVVVHLLVPGMDWATAFVLGAIVSPTDPVAASAVMRRIGVPRQLLSSVEGEGLFNDATALVAYRFAVAAVVTGSFSLAGAGLEFLLGAVGGVAIGLAVGWLSAQVRRRVDDPQVSITMSLLTGYAAYVLADLVGVSAVLATVTAGIYMGIRAPAYLPDSRTRLQGYFFWDLLDYVVNALLFVLVGLQLRSAVTGLEDYRWGELVAYGLAVAATVVLVRIGWLFSVPYLVRVVDRRSSQRARRVSASWRLVVAWSGMRGAVSLAVALAIPLTVDGGGAFPQRDLIIFLTFVVIFTTLVVQGLTLPMLIRGLGVTDGGASEEEESRGRLAATEAALVEIERLADEPWTRDDSVARLRAMYEYRRSRFAARVGTIADDGYEDRSSAWERMLRSVLAAQRAEILRLRSDGSLSNEAMNRILQDLDLEETRLDE